MSVVDSYVLLQIVQPRKAIKLMQQFNPTGQANDRSLLFVASYSQKPPAENKHFEMGFVSDTKA